MSWYIRYDTVFKIFANIEKNGTHLWGNLQGQSRKGGMQERRDSGLEGHRKGGIRDGKDLGLTGFKTVGI